MPLEDVNTLETNHILLLLFVRLLLVLFVFLLVCTFVRLLLLLVTNEVDLYVVHVLYPDADCLVIRRSGEITTNEAETGRIPSIRRPSAARDFIRMSPQRTQQPIRVFVVLLLFGENGIGSPDEHVRVYIAKQMGREPTSSSGSDVGLLRVEIDGIDRGDYGNEQRELRSMYRHVLSTEHARPSLWRKGVSN